MVPLDLKKNLKLQHQRNRGNAIKRKHLKCSVHFCYQTFEIFIKIFKIDSHFPNESY